MNNFEKGFHGNADELHAQKAYNGDQHVYKDNLENLVDPDSTDTYRELFGSKKEQENGDIIYNENGIEDENFIPRYLLESPE